MCSPVRSLLRHSPWARQKIPAHAPCLQEFSTTTAVKGERLESIIKAAYGTEKYGFTASILGDGKVSGHQLIDAACLAVTGGDCCAAQAP